jgi:hypothetical protein
MPRKENNSFSRYVGGCSEVCLTMWADGVGDRSLEHHTLGLKASEVHTHELAGWNILKIILRCRSPNASAGHRPAEVDSGVK